MGTKLQFNSKTQELEHTLTRYRSITNSYRDRMSYRVYGLLSDHKLIMVSVTVWINSSGFIIHSFGISNHVNQVVLGTMTRL